MKRLPLKMSMGRAIRIFWPSILYVITFVIYAFMVDNFYHGDGSLLHAFFPCFIPCAFVLPLVALMQLILGISIARTDSEKAFCHVLSSIVVFVLTAGFYLFVNAGNFPSV
tara:strand:+ start:118 stop:450 length:333 start_codon:yes stop_codon:yes gene_type:complete